MTITDYLGIAVSAVVVGWMGWHAFMGKLPPKPRKLETESLRQSIYEGVSHCTQSVADGERRIEHLRKLTRLAKQSNDPELMQETLMMYSEEVDHLNNERERLAHFQHLYTTFLEKEK